MKKFLLCIGLSFALLNLSCYSFTPSIVSAEATSEFTEQELKDMAKVDNAMEELVKSKKYKNGDFKTKKKLAKKMFKKLKSKGLIKNLSYSDKTFSFQYKNGVLGGMMLGEFEKYFN